MGYDYIVRGIREKKPSGLLLGGRDEVDQFLEDAMDDSFKLILIL